MENKIHSVILLQLFGKNNKHTYLHTYNNKRLVVTAKTAGVSISGIPYAIKTPNWLAKAVSVVS